MTRAQLAERNIFEGNSRPRDLMPKNNGSCIHKLWLLLLLLNTLQFLLVVVADVGASCKRGTFLADDTLDGFSLYMFFTTTLLNHFHDPIDLKGATED